MLGGGGGATEAPKTLYGDDVEARADAALEGAAGSISKAARRRERLAREERERLQAVAAEVAALGETEGRREERRLREVLAPLGLRVVDVPADGNCLYRAVAQQLGRAVVSPSVCLSLSIFHSLSPAPHRPSLALRPVRQSILRYLPETTSLRRRRRGTTPKWN